MSSKIHPIPPMTPTNQDMRELAMPLVADGYHVYSYSPRPAAEKAPATEVHLSMPFSIRDEEGAIEVRAVLRLKSTRALDELIGVLLQHRRDVWGT